MMVTRLRHPIGIMGPRDRPRPLAVPCPLPHSLSSSRGWLIDIHRVHRLDGTGDHTTPSAKVIRASGVMSFFPGESAGVRPEMPTGLPLMLRGASRIDPHQHRNPWADSKLSRHASIRRSRYQVRHWHRHAREEATRNGFLDAAGEGSLDLQLGREGRHLRGMLLDPVLVLLPTIIYVYLAVLRRVRRKEEPAQVRSIDVWVTAQKRQAPEGLHLLVEPCTQHASRESTAAETRQPCKGIQLCRIGRV